MTCTVFAELGLPLDSEDDENGQRVLSPPPQPHGASNLSGATAELGVQRLQLASHPDGTLVRCSTCRFALSETEYNTQEHIECECGGILCYECHEKGRQCRCRGARGLYKTKLCIIQQGGPCDSSKCTFAHSTCELRACPCGGSRQTCHALDSRVPRARQSNPFKNRQFQDHGDDLSDYDEWGLDPYGGTGFAFED